MKTSVSQKRIIQNCLMKNSEWQVSNLENTDFPPSASFTPSSASSGIMLKWSTEMSHGYSLWQKNVFDSIFLKIWMMIIMIIILFSLVCSCWRPRNLYYCKTSSLILVYPQGKGNPSKLGMDAFLAEPWGCSGLAAGGEIRSLEHHPTSGAALALQRHQHCPSPWFWGVLVPGCTAWLPEGFDGSASVPGVGLESAASSAQIIFLFL